jgi:hypothetical protein
LVARAGYELRLKQPPLPWLYVTVILAVVLLFEVLPYLEELARGLRRGDARPAGRGSNVKRSPGSMLDGTL